jgi:hypothetical protein
VTAKELYNESAEFREFLAAWDRDRRCPYPLGDWLLERDMIGPARCAQWCAVQPDRPVWPVSSEDTRTACGTYPNPVRSFTTESYFLRWCNSMKMEHSNEVLGGSGDRGELIEGPTPIDAILALMDAWNPEAEL